MKKLNNFSDLKKLFTNVENTEADVNIIASEETAIISVPKDTIKYFASLSKEDLIKEIEKAKNDFSVEGREYLSNSQKTKKTSIRLVYNELFFTYSFETIPYKRGDKFENIFFPYKDKEMIKYFEKELIKLVNLEIEQNILFYKLNKVILRGKPLTDYLIEPYLYDYGYLKIIYSDKCRLEKINDELYYHLVGYDDNYDEVILSSEILRVFKDGEVFIFDKNEIVIKNIELDDDFTTFKIKTNYEDIIFKVETESCGYGNPYYNTDDDVRLFVNQKIKNIIIKKSGDIEFLEIETSSNDILTFKVYQQEYYGSGFVSNSLIYNYFKIINEF